MHTYDEANKLFLTIVQKVLTTFICMNNMYLSMKKSQSKFLLSVFFFFGKKKAENN